MRQRATPLDDLLAALGEGLTRPPHAWQVAIMIAALALAWVLARVLVAQFVRRRLARLRSERVDEAALAAYRAEATHDLRRLALPVFTWLLLGLGADLMRWHHMVASAAEARLLRLAMSLTLAWALVRVLFALLRRVFRHSALIVMVERGIALAAVLGFVLYATGAWDDVAQWLVGTEIPLGAARVSLWSVLVGSFTTVLSLLSAMWLGALIEERLGEQTSLEPNLRTVLGRVVRAILLLVALLAGLAFSGIDLTVLSVFGGALGVGLGLGLQRIASNYVSGFILLLDRSLRIGDVVAVDRFHGQVTQISTRYTVLRSVDGTAAVVPNEMLVSAPVTNYTLGNPLVCLAVPVAVGPQTDLALARRLMCEAALSCRRVVAQPAPEALLKEVRDGNLLLEINFWIADPEKGRQNAQSDVAVAVIERFRAGGIVPAPPRAISVSLPCS